MSLFFDPEEYKKDYESATPDFGDDGTPLPRGWYPLRLFPVKQDVTKSGIPTVLVSATVTDGPKAGRQFLLTQYLCASKFNRKKEEDGSWSETERTEEEFKQKSKSAMYRLKGFMDACGIEMNFAAEGEGEAEFLPNYYNVQDWKNARVMGNVSVYKDKNQVKGWRPIDDEKFGRDAFLARIEAQENS